MCGRYQKSSCPNVYIPNFKSLLTVTLNLYKLQFVNFSIHFQSSIEFRKITFETRIILIEIRKLSFEIGEIPKNHLKFEVFHLKIGCFSFWVWLNTYSNFN